MALNSTSPTPMALQNVSSSLLLSLSPSSLAVTLTRASVLIMQYVLPVIVVTGVFGNFMTLVIIRRLRDQGARSSIDDYLQTLAFTDVITVIFGALPVWIEQFGVNVVAANPVSCKIFFYIAHAAPAISAWTLVAMATHRAISVVWPHRVGVICTPKLSRIVLTVIAVVFCVYYIHILYGLDKNWDTGLCGYVDLEYTRFVLDISLNVNIVLLSLLPFFCLLLSNAVLVIRLRATVSGDLESQLVTAGNDARQAKRKRQVNSVTVTAVAVSAAFIVLTLPFCLQNIVAFVYSGSAFIPSADEVAVRVFLQVSFSMLAFFNYSINFYLYCLTGARFRKQFLSILGGCRYSTDRGSSVGGDTATTAANADRHNVSAIPTCIFPAGSMAVER